MASTDNLRPQAARLGQLLADERGGELLAELQKLRLRTTGAHRSPGSGTAGGSAGPGRVGPWLAEHMAAGTALLRPAGAAPGELADWADVPDIPPAAPARRVSLIGESAARGWPLDPVFNPAIALRRYLSAASPDGYQCVDLAKTGATENDLTALVGQLPLARPDIVVAFAGNNWSLPPEETGYEAVLAGGEVRDRLALALASGGFPAMRRTFIDEVVLPRARRFCASLAALRETHGTEVIIVIPEFNLRGWHPPADAEIPVLPAGALQRWYALLDRAERACAGQQRGAAERLVAQMRRLDGGTSPVPGQLLGRLAEADGDGPVARAELEDSRDAGCGLFLRSTPRAVREVQQFLADFAREHAFPCVDLRKTLASADVPELPDESFFHDYCHLSAAGIERAMAAVADAVLGAAPGTTRPGPGVPSPTRAFAFAHAAAHLAYQGQPATPVLARLRAALDADPDLAPMLAGVLELVSGPRPAWLNPAGGELAAIPPLTEFIVALATSRALSAEQWVLRDCLAEVVGPASYPPRPAMDLLASPDTRGHLPASWTPGLSYHRATARRSVLAYALDRPRSAVLSLTYRMPDGAAEGAVLRCNGTPAAQLPACPDWTSVSVELPATAGRPGVNWMSFQWPVPAPDAAACYRAGAAALSRGEFPGVLPVFGEIFHATLEIPA